MGWSIGWDSNHSRDIGYGVVAYCDHPECNEEIDRGLSYVCAGEEPYGGDGCGLYFCSRHSNAIGECERCEKGEKSFIPKPEHPHWAWWKLTAGSWATWRMELSAVELSNWRSIAASYCPTASDVDESKSDE